MDVVYLHGPNRTRFDVRPDGALVAAGGTPFHGVVSRGLRSWLDSQFPDGPAVWESYAHLLHDADTNVTAELRELRRAAARLKVLSFGQSAQAATQYMARLGCRHALLWNIKEGHTASVWVSCADRASPFVLNVARDAVAGAELRDTSRRMRQLAATAPNVPIAAVDDIAKVELLTPAGPMSVVVVRNALIENAREVHELPDDRGYVLIDQFVADVEVPARIRGARGRHATAREHAAIDDTIAQVRAAATAGLPVEVDVNDGDVVWDGARAYVVAIG
jgi:hypothetical protein